MQLNHYDNGSDTFRKQRELYNFSDNLVYT